MKSKLTTAFLLAMAAVIPLCGIAPANAGSWKDRDRARYVVSTLNSPLCKSGRQLSTVLWQDNGARTFDVLKVKNQRNLFYIQVRKVSRALVGVYVYRFGWRLPQGVVRSQCVAKATNSKTVQPYQIKAYRRIAVFHTTYPQS